MNYRRKTRPKWVSDSMVLLALVVGTLLGSGFVRAETWYKAFAKEQYINPLSEKDIKYIEVPTKVIKYEIPQTIQDDIRAVFGEYADDAMRVLECENKGLNPKAVNDNTAWGGVGRDHGIFQINDYWQGFRHGGKATQFLHDPAINIRVAWRIFEDEGYSFAKWTCGRKLGI